MTPEFNPDVEEYSVDTTNATNTVTAVAVDENAQVVITLNGETEIESGSAATWVDGENTVEIEVTNGDVSKTYTVIVNKA